MGYGHARSGVRRAIHWRNGLAGPLPRPCCCQCHRSRRSQCGPRRGRRIGDLRLLSHGSIPATSSHRPRTSACRPGRGRRHRRSRLRRPCRRPRCGHVRRPVARRARCPPLLERLARLGCPIALEAAGTFGGGVDARWSGDRPRRASQCRQDGPVAGRRGTRPS